MPSVPRLPQASKVRLYVEPMDAVVVEVERRAILYAAKNAMEELAELIDLLQD